MSASDICKELIGKSKLTQKQVAEQMGWTEQSLSNRFRRKSLSSDEFIKMLEILGYEIEIVEAESKDEVKIRRKGVGKTVKMMVGGVKYDTSKADALCHSDDSKDMFYEIYRDDDGRYFVVNYVKLAGGVNTITPIGEEDALRIIEKTE